MIEFIGLENIKINGITPESMYYNGTCDTLGFYESFNGAGWSIGDIRDVDKIIGKGKIATGVENGVGSVDDLFLTNYGLIKHTNGYLYLISRHYYKLVLSFTGAVFGEYIDISEDNVVTNHIKGSPTSQSYIDLDWTKLSKVFKKHKIKKITDKN
jgi:hypothetical protein